eukprot:scaffold9128_cov51-Phaeocystis_antarctica.AAC.3
MHAVAFVVPPRYLPAAHLVHFDVLALGAIVPGLHGVCIALPVVAKKPGSVGLHPVRLVRSVASENATDAYTHARIGRHRAGAALGLVLAASRRVVARLGGGACTLARGVGDLGVGAVRARDGPTRTLGAVVSQQACLAPLRAQLGLVLATNALVAHAHACIGCRRAWAAHSLVNATGGRVVAGVGDCTLGLTLEVRSVGVRPLLTGQRDRRPHLTVVPGLARLTHCPTLLVDVGPCGALIARAHARARCHRASGAWGLLAARRRRVVATVGAWAARPHRGSTMRAVASPLAHLAPCGLLITLVRAHSALDAAAALRQGGRTLIGAGAGTARGLLGGPHRARHAWLGLVLGLGSGSGLGLGLWSGSGLGSGLEKHGMPLWQLMQPVASSVACSAPPYVPAGHRAVAAAPAMQ